VCIDGCALPKVFSKTKHPTLNPVFRARTRFP
jgi:hypothetical protein